MWKKVMLGILVGTGVALCAAAAEQAWSVATIPYPRPAGKQLDNGWLNRVKGMITEAEKSKDAKVVFIGDSITDFWRNRGKEAWQKSFANYKPLNWGISGDRTENVLWRLENGLLADNVKPKAFVIMIGTNNAGHRDDTSENIAAGVEKIVKLLQTKRPAAKILLLGIFPRGKTSDDKKNVLTAGANDIFKKLDNGKSVFYMDIGSNFTKDDGNVDPEVMPDYLHVNAAGYQKWADAIGPKLMELTK